MRVTDVARSRAIIDGIHVPSGEVVECLGKFVDRDATTTADVERFAGGITFDREDIRLDRVVDEGRVPRLLTVSVDDEPITVEHYGDEFGDDSSVIASGILTRPEYVELSERGSIDTVENAIL